METIQDLYRFTSLSKPTVVTIGTFDGVHVGHRKILERLNNTAQQMGLQSAVLTFAPHPRIVLQQDTGIQLLNTLEEKIDIMKPLGIDYLIVHPFTEAFSRLSATDFVRDILVERLNVKTVVIGYDHRFGRNRRATIDDLRAFGATFDFTVEEIPAQEIDAVSVSSTKIRKALLQGDIITANRYLSEPYCLTGAIQRGKGLGRQFGFPTANLHIEQAYKLIPKTGVYVVRSKIDNTTYFGMMNIGFNPTVSGTEKTIEIHFFEFDGDLYGKNIQVSLLHRLRDECKFNSVEELQEQLQKDKSHALTLIAI